MKLGRNFGTRDSSLRHRRAKVLFVVGVACVSPSLRWLYLDFSRTLHHPLRRLDVSRHLALARASARALASPLNQCYARTDTKAARWERRQYRWKPLDLLVWEIWAWV